MRITPFLCAVAVISYPGFNANAQTTPSVNPLDVLRGVLQNQRQRQESPNQAMPPRSPGMLPPAPKFEAPPTPDQSFNKLTQLNPSACEQITTSPELNKLSDEFAKLQAIYPKTTSPGLNSNNLVAKWTSERLRENNLTHSDLNAVVGKCAYALRGTKFEWLFLPKGQGPNELRSAFASYSPKQVERLDAAGNMVKVEAGGEINNPGFWTSNKGQSIVDSSQVEFSAWFLPNGQNALRNFVVSSTEQIAASVEKYNAAKATEEEKNRRNIEFTLQQKREREEKEEAKKQAAIKDQKETENRHASIRNGNLKSAQGCLDMAQAFNANFDSLAKIDPSGYTYFIGKLKEYAKETGHVADDRGGMIDISTNGGTIWINKPHIRIGETIEVFGKYIKNSNIMLTNGTAGQIQNVQLLCIEPY